MTLFDQSGAGGTLYDNQINPTKITVNTPEGIAGLAAYQSMFTNKLVPPYNSLASSQWGGGDIASLETNRIAMSRVGDWNIDEINSKNLNYGIMPAPTIQKSVMLSGANSKITPEQAAAQMEQKGNAILSSGQ